MTWAVRKEIYFDVKLSLLATTTQGQKEEDMPLGARGVKYAAASIDISPGTVVTCGLKGKKFKYPDYNKVNGSKTAKCPHCGEVIWQAWCHGDTWGVYKFFGCLADGGGASSD